MKTKIELKDFLNIKFLSGIKAKEDGTYAYIKHDCNEKENKYERNLFVNNVAYTNHGKASFYLLEKDYVLYADALEADIKRKEKETFTSFYRLPLKGGAAFKAFEIPHAVSSMEELDEGLYAVICECHKDDFDGDVNAKRLARKKLKEDVEVLEEIPFYFNGAGFVDGNRSVLFLYNEKTNELTQISDVNESIDCMTIDKAQNKIYYVSTLIDKKHDLISHLYVYDLNTLEKTLLRHQDYSIYELFLTSYGLVFMGSDCQKYGINENPQFYLFDGEKVSLFASCDMGIGSSVGSDSRLGRSKPVAVLDDVIYFIGTQYDNASIYALYPNQEIKCIYETLGSVDGLAAAGQSLYFIMMEANGLQEVYCLDLSTNEVKQITTYNQNYVETKNIIPVERCNYVNDGIEFQGWVIKPADYDPDKTYPGLLDVHGGPKTVYGNVYYHEMQMLANQGYFVFFTNPRGSDGRGNEFADIRGKYGTIDYSDLMTFVDKVLETYPQIDASRLGVFGGSYGGFMTNWIIGHTNRFAAAATQRSIANWISFYNTSDIGEVFGDDQCGGNPWDDYEKLWNHSPLKYARNVKTPTLVIHADEDYRCPLSEGLQMYSALAMQKIDTKMVIFKHENHELSRGGAIRRRILRLEEIMGWMDKHLKGEC